MRKLIKLLKTDDNIDGEKMFAKDIPDEGLAWWLSGKVSICVSLIPRLERSLGKGNDNLLQYFCLGNPMDRGSWWATVLGVWESDITEQLSTFSDYDVEHLFMFLLVFVHLFRMDVWSNPLLTFELAVWFLLLSFALHLQNTHTHTHQILILHHIYNLQVSPVLRRYLLLGWFCWYW